jgi:O-antigen ligase
MTTLDAVPAGAVRGTGPGAAVWPILGLVVGVLGVGLIQLAGSWGFYSLLAIVALAWTPWVARIAGGVEPLLQFLFVFALQLQLGFHVIHFDGPKPAGSRGIYVSLVLVTAAALAGWWMLHPRARRRVPLVVDGALLRASVVFFLATLLSFVNTPWRMMSTFGLFEVGVLAFVALVAARACATPEGLASVFAVLQASLLFQSAVVFTEHAIGVPLSLTQGVSKYWAWGDERFAGTLGAPSAAGTFLAINLLFVLGHQMLGERPERRSPWTRVTIVAGFLALLLTQTRSAWVAMLLGAAGLVWTRRRRESGRVPIGRLGGYAAGAALLLLVTWPIVGSRLSDNHVAAFWQRWYLIRITLQMVYAHPAIGIGVNTATDQVWNYARGVPPPSGFARWVFVAHNQFVLLAAETGLVGLAAFVALFARSIRSAHGAMYARDATLRTAATVVFWALVMMVWALNVDMVAATMTYVLLWFLFGMAAGVRVQMRRAEAMQLGTAT